MDRRDRGARRPAAPARGARGGGGARHLTGVWNTLTKIALPLVGVVTVGVVGAAGFEAGWAVTAAVAAGLLLTVGALWVLGHEDVGRRGGALLQRPVAAVARRLDRQPPADLPEQVVAFQRSTTEALRRRPVALAGAYSAHRLTHVALVWLGMVVAGRAGGIATGWPEVLLAFSVGYLLTGLPVSAGGLGTLDVAVVAILAGLGEDPAIASAGLVVYRVSTYAVYGLAVIGWLGWRWWQRRRAA